MHQEYSGESAEKEIVFHEIGKDAMYKIWHALDGAMFIYIHAGDGSIVCSEKAYPIRKGVLCFVGAGKYHYTMPEVPKHYDRSKLFLSTEEIKSITSVLPKSDMFSADTFVYAQIPESEQASVEQIFEKMTRCASREPYSSWMRMSCTVDLMVFLHTYTIENLPAGTGIVSRGAEYINSHIHQELCLDGICDGIHVSKYHFCRLFKKTMGVTVMEYILKTRIVMAKQLLSHEALSVTEIAARCGFGSISYFSRIFKEETGETPMQYKKRMKEKR